MKEKNLKNYIHEISEILKENALEAKIVANNSKTKNEEDFNNGFLMAYHQVIATMKNQAHIFHLEQKDIGLEDIEPERDLV